MTEINHLCGFCLEDNNEQEGVVFCSKCEQVLCIECKREHTGSKATRRHELFDLADVAPRD
ncbi:hypothetical protein DPMN_156734 [Dreissena polymorpha]|uniref:B box-type domain-containing protein n=1 Tax=Dreissena polymorpha TaxID=45954 RepID=A0A9D4FU29_DREPO|nr:hypothetical protein DPMN_156734 [Dreissena polymorpha]